MEKKQLIKFVKEMLFNFVLGFLLSSFFFYVFQKPAMKKLAQQISDQTICETGYSKSFIREMTFDGKGNVKSFHIYPISEQEISNSYRTGEDVNVINCLND